MSRLNKGSKISVKQQIPGTEAGFFDESTFSQDSPQADWRWAAGASDCEIGEFDVSNLELDFEPWPDVIKTVPFLRTWINTHRMLCILICRNKGKCRGQQQENRYALSLSKNHPLPVGGCFLAMEETSMVILGQR